MTIIESISKIGSLKSNSTQKIINETSSNNNFGRNKSQGFNPIGGVLGFLIGFTNGVVVGALNGGVQGFFEGGKRDSYLYIF
ncbi:hypothetical protein DDB_G0269390 [Dictyostelium discoideum AX4]|uniref:Uncharacterized protein n=1 Tax=Dictyostelium discoideum TaxID=44689 RepID=Q55E53_DICDI|nr:hypothetical protein DDB_G0269390 [Dictyostelium discoideum AX4]EAL72045.1 hypothetical protein DDB_G0269390 [Dictyostelium discoideum AX4]|eukprot:XP_645928.1 hypothetical protein DDB_G0269390 [Dictyostelium discoideum AX4]